MVQAVAAYLIVAAALAWVVWSVFLPRTLKQRLKTLGRPEAARKSASRPEHLGPGSTPPPD